MKAIFFIAALTLSQLNNAIAQSEIPRFEDYAVKTVYDGKNVKPKLDKDTYMFRTRIRYAAKQKRNFAGEFVLAEWGCGALCRTAVAINVRTGDVYSVPFTICCWITDERDLAPIVFGLNSRLIAFYGLRNESDKDSEKDVHCYEFRNGRFRFIRTVNR